MENKARYEFEMSGLRNIRVISWCGRAFVSMVLFSLSLVCCSVRFLKTLFLDDINT